MKSYNELRALYPDFCYKSYEIIEHSDSIELVFNFSIKNLASFSPRWVFPKGEKPVDVSESTFKNMVFSLGLAELVSYWKITCSPNVTIEAGHLSEEQKRWWKKLYFNGLGEFFFLNNIEADPSDFMSISSTGEELPSDPSSRPLSGNLIPVGGGKDSSVSMELLKEFRIENRPYIINGRGATNDSVEVAGYSNAIIVKRTLDKEMLRLNSEGFLNGHTPFSAIVAFSSIIASYIFSLKYVVLSNESSANESTVSGSSVNHQYSKSFEFEEDFHNYESKFIKSGVYYFSLLRPLSEYQIAKYFSKLTKYHPVFRSCNKGSKTNSWCANCSKCLFVWLIMSPFLSFEQLTEIFGRNMADDESLIPTLDKLIGASPEKPFECVGSRNEVNFAICAAIKKSDKLPRLYEYYKTTPLYEKYSSQQNPYDEYYDRQNLLPEKFRNIVERECF